MVTSDQASKNQSFEYRQLTAMNSLQKLIKIFLGLSVFVQLTGCAQTVQWQEEVALLDGQVAIVIQKKLCGGGDYTAATRASCLARDAWVTLKLPEFSDKEILWHEALDPIVINIYQGKLYIVGVPPTTVEFRAYGASNPPYFGFVWNGKAWQSIPFDRIPVAIYDGNMLIESIPKTRTVFLTLAQKKEENRGGYLDSNRRIDPNHKRRPH